MLALAALATASVSAPEIYVSGAVGSSNINVDCAGTTRCDRNGTAAKLTGGYQINKALSAEIGYLNFGKATLADSSLSVDLKATAVTLGLAYTLPLNTQWNVDLRGGVARVESKLSVSGYGSISENNTTGYVGLGLGYTIDRNIKIEAGLDFSRAEIQGEKGEKGDLRAISIGARYSF